MADPIKWKSKIILFKIETEYGTDPTPAGAANAMLLTDVQLQPMEGQDVSRNLEQPWLGGQLMYPAGLRVVLTGSIELVGSGETGVAPAWGPLARACALAEVVTADETPGDGTVVYSPVSDDHESGTAYFWIGGTQHVLKGCRGTGVVTLNAQSIPVMRVTLTGLFAAPGEVTRAAPTLTAFKKPEIVTNAKTPTFEVNEVPLVMRSYSLDLGNDVQPRLLVGREQILIVERTEEIAASVEALPLSTLNPFALAEAATLVPVTIEHGTIAGYRVAIEAPTCQVKRMSGYENQQGVLEWPLRLAPLPASGNDQFTITLT